MEQSKTEQAESRRLRRNLTALIEFSKSVNSSLDLEFTLNNLLLSCMGKFLTTKGFVALFRHGKLEIVKEKGLGQIQRDSFPQISQHNTPDREKMFQEYSDASGFVVEPINSSRGILGCVGLGRKINGQEYSADEISFLKTILNIASTAIENSEMIGNLTGLNRNLDERINRLGSLFELSKEFSSLTDEERIGKLLLYSLLGNFMISTYAILYLTANKLKILQSTIQKKVIQDAVQTTQIQQVSKPLLGEDVRKILPKMYELGCVVALPLTLRSETKGLLLLGKRLDNKEYLTEDIEFITSIGNLGLNSLENRRLFKEALEKQKMEEELEIAKEIQRNLLPKTIVQPGGYEIVAETIPSKFVSGDYYDVISLPDGKLCIAIADVSGKGVPASLLMANVQAFLKSVCKQCLPIGAATVLLNDLISENTSDGRFITFFWMYFDALSGKLQYVNAGHNPPILLRGNKISYLDKGGMIFGVMKTVVPYEVQEIQLQRGDRVVLFTDGVTEAKNTLDEEYTDQRLESMLLLDCSTDARSLMRRILEDIHSFVQNADQSDDITLMILRAV